jgi:hypothetical protein
MNSAHFAVTNSTLVQEKRRQMLILQPDSQLAWITSPALPMLPNTEFCFAMQKIKASPHHPRRGLQWVMETQTISRVLIS